MSSFHPNIRLPLWAAVAVPFAAYAYRSFARGWDWRPDVPIDLIVLGLYVLVLVAALASRRAATTERLHEQIDDHQQAEGGEG